MRTKIKYMYENLIIKHIALYANKNLNIHMHIKTCIDTDCILQGSVYLTVAGIK